MVDYGTACSAFSTTHRYPDPALQVDVDLSHVSFAAPANAIDGLPGPLRDRFRVIEFPRPSLQDLKALLPAVIEDLARERAVDLRWIPPLSQGEQALVARAWSGGSMRLLRRVVEAVLRQREHAATRN